MRYTLLSLFVVTACGQVETPSETPTLTYMGATLYAAHPVNPNEFAYMVNMALYKTGLPSLENVSIHLEASPPETDGQPVGGVTYPRRKLIRMYQQPGGDCLTSTHMAHELTHWLQFLVTGLNDPEHTDPVYWSAPDAVQFDLYAFDLAYCRSAPDTQTWLLARSQPD